MIVPMKKITLVVLEKEKKSALSALRRYGLVHIERREAMSAELSVLQASLSTIDQAISVLQDFGKEKVNKGEIPGDTSSGDACAERVLALRDSKRIAIDAINGIDRELERLSPWGDIDPESFKYLGEKGINLIPVEVPTTAVQQLCETIPCLTVSKAKKTAQILIVLGRGEPLPSLPTGCRELALPAKSCAVLRLERVEALARIPEIDASLTNEYRNMPSLLSAKSDLLKKIEFETVRAGMELIALGDAGAGSPSDLAWLCGYVPASDESSFAAAAKEHGWAFVSDDPSDDDNVPTKIQNNRFVNLISPLLDFLGTVPGYREIDISLWFLLFFGVFFAMIFGDGGYGLLMVILSSAGIVSSLLKGKKAETGLYMFLYLGVMTVAWGAVTCTWFGIPAGFLPGWLRAVAVPAFSNENPEAAVNIQVFCFVLGLMQISLAHVIGIIRNIKTLKFLGELGSLLMVVGMFFVVLNLVVDAERFPLPPAIVYMIAVGFALNFAFINYSGSIGASVLESLKNIITMCLGVVNVFGDVMSYIRLWAVGLAGAAISGTVNTMAGPMLGGLVMFVGLFLLVFGHGLNFILNVLSVIVHGVRLNTLEFSNHLGLTWSGYKYAPFSETAKK